MKHEELAVTSRIELPGSQPLALTGEGKSLRGYVRVSNPGPQPLNLREAVLRLQPLGTNRLAAFGQNALSLTLQPGQSARVRLSFDYDPLTPPGEYDGELALDGTTQPVKAYLAEVVQLVISPSRLVIDQPSGTVTRRVVFGNEGNVPLRIAEAIQLALGKELLLRRGISATVAGAGEKSTGALERLFAEFVRDEHQAAFGDAGQIEARFPAGPITLQPGEVKAAEIQIALPAALEAGARYIARAPLYTSDLELVIVPPPGKAPKPARPPRKTE